MRKKKANAAFHDKEIQKGEELLKIDDLSVTYTTRDMGVCKAVNHVNLSLKKGETLGLVGETGAGKTTIALSILRLIESPPGELVSGTVRFKDQDLYFAAPALQPRRGESQSRENDGNRGYPKGAI